MTIKFKNLLQVTQFEVQGTASRLWTGSGLIRAMSRFKVEGNADLSGDPTQARWVTLVDSPVYAVNVFKWRNDCALQRLWRYG